MMRALTRPDGPRPATSARASRATVMALTCMATLAGPALASSQADAVPVLATGGSMPDVWIDEDTGHRVQRLSRRDGSSRSFYFHSNPFLPTVDGSGSLMVYYGSTDTGSQIFVLDLETLESRQLTHHEGRIFGEILGPRELPRSAGWGHDIVSSSAVSSLGDRTWITPRAMR